MSIDLVVAGSHGSAARTQPSGHDGSRIVDVWTVYPRLGVPVSLIVTRALTGVHEVYVLTLASINPDVATQAARLSQPAELAYQVHVVERLAVYTDAQAREVASHLARQTTAGTLTARPDTDDERQAWRAVLTALAAVAVDGPRPGGFRAGVGKAVTAPGGPRP